eukprot:266380-Rhodomonas_salina.1
MSESACAAPVECDGRSRHLRWTHLETEVIEGTYTTRTSEREREGKKTGERMLGSCSTAKLLLPRPKCGTLDLSNNQFIELPEGLLSLSYLADLKIKGNPLPVS